MCRGVLFLTMAALCVAGVARAATPVSWQAAIRPDDRLRLLGLWPAWTSAKAAAVDHGRTADWVGLGALADPARAADGDWPPAGSYRCRLVKLGARLPGMSDVAPTREFPCAVTNQGGVVGFVVNGAFQASTGRLYPDGERMIYLGAMTLRGDMSPFAYGADPDRNQVGVLERIGPARWRLALPWPRFQSTLDVVDIVPAS
jgi:hypothetical protein